MSKKTNKRKLSTQQPLTGKVSVVHFLNQQLKPKFDDLVKVNRYPLYMRATFNKKSTKIKSNIELFFGENIRKEIDVFEFIQNRMTFSQGGAYLSEDQFRSSEYLNAMKEENRVVCEIIQFYGMIGINILVDNPVPFINISLPFIKKVFSDFLWKKFKSNLHDPDIKYILNFDAQFDKQIEVIMKYGNSELKSQVSQFNEEYQMMKLLSAEDNFRIYEWGHLKTRFMEKFKEHPIFLMNLRKAIVDYYEGMFLQEHNALMNKLREGV